MFFFFKNPATTEIYTLSLHDPLPIYAREGTRGEARENRRRNPAMPFKTPPLRHASPPFVRRLADRKSTRLNSSHANISYAVFCLKKKKPHKRIRATSTSRLP